MSFKLFNVVDVFLELNGVNGVYACRIGGDGGNHFCFIFQQSAFIAEFYFMGFY